MANKVNGFPLGLVFLILFIVFSAGSAAGETIGWFPDQPVFDPPRANLREPVITFRYFREKDKDMAEANIAARIPFRGWEKNGVTYQVGLEGGAFNTDRMDTNPITLKNADYRVAVPLHFQKGNFSGRFQIYHQSSHLGDTYARNTGRESIHWSRQKVDLLLAEKIGRFRIYGGGGLLFDVDPDVEKDALQAGWEYIRPVSNNWDFYFSQDLQSRAEVGWNPDTATQTGFGFHERNGKERIRFFLEYFHGHSPEGQFSDDVEEWAGIGSSLFL
jgi:hypothetical protein